jgi:hypothetical protein
MSPPDSGVTVRMYNPRGLGDCFLLAFRAQDETARYMLIDCGIFQFTKGESKKMKAIVQNISEATGGHLHVVVVTHEHWDHLAGFYHARDIFDDMEIDELWLAWTEDPTDPLAQRLYDRYNKKLRALTAAVARLEAANNPSAEALKGVLHFDFEDALFGAAEKGKAAQLEYLRAKSSLKPPPYRRPGERPLTLPGVKGVKIYVLGPPRDEKLISRSNPRKGEAYEETLALDELQAFYLAVLAADGIEGDEKNLYERSFPFGAPYHISTDDIEKYKEHARFFHKRYGFCSSKKGDGPEWRRIDTDWLAAAGQLALDHNSHTNNTSLVLAIELTKGGKVLLFAADAQVGNWLSWHDLSWPEEGVTGADLLQRTTLYKVGHHGSHNATLRDKGLEMMNRDLVAMIPVNVEWTGNKKPHPWKMPFKPLLEALEEKTKGRIICADTGIPAEKPKSLSPDEWQAFLSNVGDPDPDGLWVQYTVPE